MRALLALASWLSPAALADPPPPEVTLGAGFANVGGATDAGRLWMFPVGP